MTIDDVRLTSESGRWVILTLYKGAIVVLPREHFVAGLRRGKGWKRASAMRARKPDVETAAERRRAAKRGA